MSEFVRARLERRASWWLWGAALVIALTAGAYPYGALSGLDDASPTVAQTAQLRAEILRVAGAADQAALSGDADVLEDAIAAIEEQRQSLAAPVAELLGADDARAALARLDAALAELSTAARAYASGSAEAGAGSEAFSDAATEVDSLVTRLAAVSTANTGELRDRATAGIALLTLGTVLAIVGCWYSRGQLSRSRRRERALAQQPDELTNDLPVMLYQAEPDGRLLVVSGSSSMLLGRTRGELAGRPLLDFTTELPAFKQQVPPSEIGSALHDVVSVESEWRHADGSLRSLHTVARAVRDAEGRLTAMRCIVRDLSEQHAAQRALRESEERFRTVLETAQNGIMVVSGEGVIELTNSALREMLGYSAEELLRRPVRDLMYEADSDHVLNLVARPIWSDEPRTRRQDRFVCGDGAVLDVDLSLSSFREQDRVTGVLIEVRDITESKRAEETIQRLAYFDELTGLPNRAAFNRELGRSLEVARQNRGLLAVLLFDLDQFKLINDSLGHHAGDRLLRAVAERLQARLPQRYTLARLGGDEFMLLAAVDHADAAPEVARNVLDALEQPFTYEGQELDVAASVGVTVFPADGTDAETLIRRADSAMYQAKALGRNTYASYSQSMEQDTQGRLNMHSRVRRALSEDQFVLHYQPLIDARDGRIVGSEALVRWNHPERGLVAPNDFIPILEDTGLIIPVGEWVLREACGQSLRWQEQGLAGANVSVNLSGRQVLQGDLLQMVERTLADSRLAPGMLTLEITENVAMENMEVAIRVLTNLRELGIDTTLDDFGTGHSSLSHLKELPVVGVKIDRSFVSDVTEDEGARTIVTGVVALGHALRLNVAAEGVETESQSHFLRSLDCDLLQGFLFSRPLPASDFEELLRGQSERAGRAA